MNFVSPARDPGFADNPIHGARAQAEFIRKVVPYCRDFRVACDIGAHIGTCTEALVTKFGRVWAFEPQAENFACLKANIGDRAMLENVALGSAEDSCEMVLAPGANSGMWHAKPGLDVDVETLDNYMLSDVDLIKIDTEGFEGQVIRGAIETIAASKPVVVFEDNGLGAKYYGVDWIDPKPLLKALGYSQKVRIRKDEVWMHL